MKSQAIKTEQPKFEWGYLLMFSSGVYAVSLLGSMPKEVGYQLMIGAVMWEIARYLTIKFKASAKG